MFARRGHRVYVSNLTPMRNREVRALLYDENPFISGWTHAPANAGNARKPYPAPDVIRFGSIIRSIEAEHGLPPTNLYPRIYYQPRFVRELRDKVIIDPRSHSQSFRPDMFRWFVKRLGFSAEISFVIESPGSGPNGTSALRDYPRLHIETLHSYIDAIYSCVAYVGTESGGSAIASAIRQDRNRPELYALATTHTWNHRVFIFPNISYTVVSGIQPDW